MDHCFGLLYFINYPRIDSSVDYTCDSLKALSSAILALSVFGVGVSNNWVTFNLMPKL